MSVTSEGSYKLSFVYESSDKPSEYDKSAPFNKEVSITSGSRVKKVIIIFDLEKQNETAKVTLTILGCFELTTTLAPKVTPTPVPTTG